MLRRALLGEGGAYYYVKLLTDTSASMRRQVAAEKSYIYITYYRVVHVRILAILFVAVKPFCKPDQIQVYGVAKRERIRVSCDVISNPSVDLQFEWVFNSSSERLDVQENLIEVRGTRSLAHHTPQVIFSSLLGF